VVSGCMYIACADITLRSMYRVPADSGWRLSSPICLRGVHLGLNLAGMFLLMPISFVGISIVLYKIEKFRDISRRLFNYASALALLSLMLLVAVAGLVVHVITNEPTSGTSAVAAGAFILQTCVHGLFVFFADRLILLAIAREQSRAQELVPGDVPMMDLEPNIGEYLAIASKQAVHLEVDGVSNKTSEPDDEDSGNPIHSI
jgi:hypothetical protein